MKILFDHQIFSYQRHGGASKYFCELLRYLPREMWITSTVYSNNVYLETYKLFPHKNILSNLYFKGQGRIMFELGRINSINTLKKGEFDIFHQTHYEPYCLDSIGNKPMVINFHDSNFSTYNKNEKIIKFQKKTFARANKIIVISNNTKNDLLNIFDISEDKTRLIYLGVDRVDIKSLQPERLVQGNYILYVGARDGNKNWNNFVKVYNKIKKKYSHLKLVCTGKYFSVKEINFIKMNNLQDGIIHISATEEQMNRLYRDAELFVFPSYYEGFGMPLLEAMACNCPVVCSNTSCFPEVAGDAAYYFDPHSENDMFDVISKVLNSKETREELRKNGIKRAELFSWEKCAEEHIKLYKDLYN